MTGKKNSFLTWILWIIVLLCVADLIHMTYRKIVNDAQTEIVAGTSAPTESIAPEEPKVEGNIQAGIPFVEQQEALAFEGQQKVDADSIPWQTNCGIVEDEELGACLFLTPNTAVAFACSPESAQSLVFDAQIYPAVQQASDGCSLRVQIFAEGSQQPLADDILQIASTDQAQSFSVDLSPYAGQNIWIRLACGNGQNNNDDGDWLFFTACAMQ